MCDRSWVGAGSRIGGLVVLPGAPIAESALGTSSELGREGPLFGGFVGLEPGRRRALPTHNTCTSCLSYGPALTPTPVRPSSLAQDLETPF